MLGFVASYMGYLPPSMLNITASKIVVERTKKEAQQFILGVLLAVVIQLGVALLVITYFKDFSVVLKKFEKFAVLSFTLISLFFLHQAIHQNSSSTQVAKQNSFRFGIALSLINLLAIPFFVLEYQFFMSKGWVQGTATTLATFGVGTVLGVFAVMHSYIRIACKFQQKIKSITTYFNWGVAMLAGMLAVYYGVKLYF